MSGVSTIRACSSDQARRGCRSSLRPRGPRRRSRNARSGRRRRDSGCDRCRRPLGCRHRRSDVRARVLRRPRCGRASSCRVRARRSRASERSRPSFAAGSCRRSSISTAEPILRLADAPAETTIYVALPPAGLAPQRRALSRRDRRPGLPRAAHVGLDADRRARLPRRHRAHRHRDRRGRGATDSSPCGHAAQRRPWHGSTSGWRGPTTPGPGRRWCSWAGSSRSPRSASSRTRRSPDGPPFSLRPWRSRRRSRSARSASTIRRRSSSPSPFSPEPGRCSSASRRGARPRGRVVPRSRSSSVLAVWPEVNALAAIGPHPDGGGRFYGVTNQVETLLLAPSLAAAALAGVAGAVAIGTAAARDGRLEPSRGGWRRAPRRRSGVRGPPRRARARRGSRPRGSSQASWA